MKTNRVNRVKESLQKEVSLIIQRHLKDPRVGFVTVTGVKLSDDLRYARVLVSIYGEEEKKKQTMVGLQSATGFIRSQIGKSVRLRYVPEITFEYDKSADYSARIYEILAGWEKQDKGNG